MKSKLLKMLFFVIYFFAASQYFPQQKLTLKEAVSIALENNYSIKIAKGNAEISDNNYSIGNAGFLPKIDATGSSTRTVNNTKQEYSSGSSVDKINAGSNSTNAGIVLSWTLFDGFKMFTTFSKLREYKELGEIQLRVQIETSVFNLIKNYYDVVKQKYNYLVVKEIVSISEERVKLVEERLSVGSASQFDLLNAKVDLNADKSNLLNQELLLNNLKTSLNLLLARNISTDFDVEDSIKINDGFSYDALLEEAFKNNTSILTAEKNKLISASDVTLSKTDYFPKINLTGGYNYLSSTSDAGLVKSNKSYGYNYGLNFSWNIFNGTNTMIDYQNAVIALDQNEINISLTKADVESALSVAYKSYQMNKEILKLEEENVSVAKENLDLAMEQLKLGSISSLEFREVQKSYISARDRLSSAKYTVKMSEEDLLKQSGRLIQEN